MSTFQNKLLARTNCDEAGHFAVPNVLSPRDLVEEKRIGFQNNFV